MIKSAEIQRPYPLGHGGRLILKVEGLYYLCSENKGADQLCGYREADLAASLFSYIQKAGLLTMRLIYKLQGLEMDRASDEGFILECVMEGLIIL